MVKPHPDVAGLVGVGLGLGVPLAVGEADGLAVALPVGEGVEAGRGATFPVPPLPEHAASAAIAHIAANRTCVRKSRTLCPLRNATGW